jgi:hypothetical protein
MIKMDELKTDLMKFVKEEILSKKPDGIAPIARRGFALLNLLKDDLPLLNDLLINAESLCPEQAKNKYILVFDDTVKSGRKLNEVAKMLRNKGANVEKVVFVVHQACPPENRPVKPKFDKYYDVDNEKYIELSRGIIELLLLAGRPLDIDHLEIRLKLSNETVVSFVDLLRSIGHFYDVPSIANENGVKVCTLDEPSFFNLENVTSPAIVRKEGVTKIRFWIQPSGEIFCVPMTYPIIACDKSFSTKDCEAKETWGKAFCKEFKDQYDSVNLRTCSDCVTFHLHESLGYAFFKVLNERKTGILLVDAGFQSLKIMYKDQSEKLSSFIKERIHSLVH